MYPALSGRDVASCEAIISRASFRLFNLSRRSEKLLGLGNLTHSPEDGCGDDGRNIRRGD